MQAVGASERVFDLIDRNPKIDLHCGLTPGDPIGSIAFKNLNFSYPSRPDITVLRDINFEIAPGEIVALVGPSGSGKSTIAALITRLYDPDSGHITFDNDELSQLDPTWLREQIGVVSQEPILFSTTIEENIRYGKPTTGQQEVLEAAAIANASDFIEEFPEKWQTEVGERGVQLSGGQKQRIAIARAVLKNPRLLILDEATSALDSESEYLVQDALEHLMRNRTTLIIAHRLSTVKNAHRVMVLDDGVLVQSGDHHSLMNESGLYKSLVERQLSA